MISVVMSTYKEPRRYVEQAVDSILSQTYQDIELILIVDDPDNRDVIQYIQSKSQKDHRIIYQINETNCGIVESLNRGIRLARGEYLARMDADDISEPDRLETELEYLISNHLDLVGCNVRDIDEDGNIINREGTHYPTSDKVIKKYLNLNNGIPHPTWLMRKSILDNTHLYRDFSACEDYEFLTRMALNGKRLGNVKEPKLRYRINKNGISCNKKVLQKTGSSYIRKKYAAGKKCDVLEFHAFLESVEGRRKAEGLKKYYEQSARLKEHLAHKRWGSFLFSGIGTFLRLEEARQVVKRRIKEWVMGFVYGGRY